jgi:hypothetical protein
LGARVAAKRVCILTGGTAEFFPFLRECVDSLVACGVLKRADLGVLDQGMTDEQIASFRGIARRVVRLSWDMLGMRVPAAPGGTLSQSGQHACHATIALDHYPATFVHARHNWLPQLSHPTWDS